MINKKGLLLGLGFLVLFAIVLAAPSDSVDEGINQLNNNVEAFLGFLVQNIGPWLKSLGLGFLVSFTNLLQTREVLFYRILWTILLAIIIYFAVELWGIFDRKEYLKMLLSGALAIISIWFVPASFFDLVLPAWQSLFATGFVIFPFFVITYFSIKTDNIWVSRIVWVVLIIYGGFLFFTEGTQAFQTGNFAKGFVFLGFALGGIIMLIFIRPVRRWFFKGEMDAFEADSAAADEVDVAIRKSRKREAKAYKKALGK